MPGTAIRAEAVAQSAAYLRRWTSARRSGAKSRLVVGAGGAGHRVDGRLVVLYNGNVYLFEFKVADKYRRPGMPVHLIEFGREERNIVRFEFETV